MRLRRPKEPCVLVVDDERDVLELVRDVLEDDGLGVIPVQHPSKVKELGHRYRPDVLLVDLMLPGTNGIQFARELQNNGMSSTPMIAMSASSSMLREASESELFEATLAKPFDIRELLDAVEQHVQRPNSER